jgi:hypothetical protein
VVDGGLFYRLLAEAGHGGSTYLAGANVAPSKSDGPASLQVTTPSR